MFLVDVKHKLETQDIFLGKTVQKLVAEIEALQTQLTYTNGLNEAVVNENTALKTELTRQSAVVEAAKRVFEGNIFWWMDGHEDDGGVLCCVGCDNVKGLGHEPECKVGNLAAALAEGSE